MMNSFYFSFFGLVTCIRQRGNISVEVKVIPGISEVSL